MIDTSNPTIVAALVAAIVTALVGIVTLIVSLIINQRNIRSEASLAEKKFEFDKEIANRKFDYDRKFHLYQRQVELGEELTASFLEAVEVVRAIRHPAAYATEGKTRKRSENESEEVAKLLDTYFIALERINDNRKFIAELLSKKYRAVAVFGQQIEGSFDSVNKSITKVSVSASMIMQTISVNPRAINILLDDFCRQCEHDIWYSSAIPDQIAEQMDEAAKLVQQICGSVLRSSPEV